MISRPHLDLCFQDHLKLNGADIKMRLVRRKDVFSLMGEGKVKIEDVALFVRKVKVDPLIQWMCVPLGNVLLQPPQRRAWYSHKKSNRTSLGRTNRALFESSYYNVCKRPMLEEIELVAKFPETKKETTRLATSANHSYTGGTPVLQIQDITPFERHQTYPIPILLHDHCVEKIDTYKWTEAC